MAEAALVIEEAGLAMTIQGRPFRTARHHGVPLAGPADAVACTMANWLAGNPAGSPALEWALSGFSGHVTIDTALGIAGAVGSLTISGQPHNPHETALVKSGDHIRITPSRHGARLYLAVSGGFAVDTILGANSTYPPAGLGTAAAWPMEAGDAMPVRSSSRPPSQRILPKRCRQDFTGNHALRYVPYAADEAKVQNTTEQSTWLVTKRCDRSAVQIKPGPGQSPSPGSAEAAATMPSNAVFPGAIQLPPDGQPLLMGVDGRTTGGYVVAGQIIRADRHLLGQMRAGDRVGLIATPADKAREMYRDKLELWRRYLPDLKLD
ncbi:MAG: biotin-dependent carboxyltransferase family protein [Pseudomonadota bacterium]